MKTSYFLLIVVIAGSLFMGKISAQVNNYEVIKGERPPIDLTKISDEFYENGIIKIKLDKDHIDQIEGIQLTNDDSGILKFNIESIDNLNNIYQVKTGEQRFKNLSSTTKHAEKHTAWGFHLWYTLFFDNKIPIQEIIDAYSQLPEVEIAEPEFKKISTFEGNVEPFNILSQPNSLKSPSDWVPNDVAYSFQWNLNNTGQAGGTPEVDLDMPEAWDIEKGNSDVIVAIIDQGVQANHPDLAGNMWVNILEQNGTPGVDDDGNGYIDDIHGYDFYEGNSTIEPAEKACLVAGVISAVNNNGAGVSSIAGGSGTNDGVRLMTCQAISPLDAYGAFDEAMIYAADNGACISQNSWTYAAPNVFEQSVLDAIDYFNANGGGAALSGGITIFPVSNKNSNDHYYPAFYSGAFSVTATNNQDEKAFYADYGSWIDISAPGGESSPNPEGQILSTRNNNGYGFYSGTSVACPQVSGVASLVISLAYGSLSATDVADILKNSAEDHYGVNPAYIGLLGSGRVNAYQALLETQNYISGPPVADFIADNLNPGLGNTVTFTDLSTNNPDTWLWTFTPPTVTFVGGTTASDQNPQVQFDAIGLYTVELMVSNPNGSDTEIKTDYINVIYLTPETDFVAANITPGIGVPVSFLDLSTNNPDTWSWNFTPNTVTYVDGTTSSDQNPHVQFDAGGLYTVELTSSNPAGSDTETKVDYINVYFLPTADFEADNLNPGLGNPVNFSDLSTGNPITWTWTFTPPTVTFLGGTTANDQNPQVQFDAIGLYTVELSVSNPSGNDTETKTDYIDVIYLTPIADFEADILNPGIGQTVSFTDLSANSPDTWTWTFTPSTVTYVGGTTANDQNPQVQFDAGGLYTVELTASNPAGSDTETKIDYINVFFAPVADFMADNLNPNIGDQVNFTDLSTNNPNSWLWTFTPTTVTYLGGTTANDQNPQVQFDAGGLYTVELTVSNPSGNDTEIKTDYIDVIYLTPITDFEADILNPGIGQTVTFTDLSANSPDTWTWSFTPPTVTYVGGTTANDQNPQVQFDAGGLYTVELSASNPGGSDTETKIDYIDVIFAPVADFMADNLNPFIGDQVNFTDLSTNNPDTWLWTFTPPTVTFLGGTTANDQNPQVQFDASGIYTVELFVSNISGNDTEIKSDYITVLDLAIELDIKVILEGAYNGIDMNIDLLSYIPFAQPYNTSPWNYAGTESVLSLPGSDIVDWILVEVRDATDAANALPATIIGTQAVFLRNDGQVLDLDGNATISFDITISEGLFLVIHHRNHLSMMSSVALIESGGIYTYDFTTDVSQAYLDGQNLMVDGSAAMISGNALPDDNEVNAFDINSVWYLEAGLQGYLPSDFNLDSQSNNIDKNDYWVPNEGKVSQMP